MNEISEEVKLDKGMRQVKKLENERTYK